MPHPVKDPLAHFWKKVDRRGRDDCWPWIGCKNAYGYGVLRIQHFKHIGVMAHRISYFIATGDVPPADLCVMHSCDNPPCCNPAHLSLGTKAENLQDMCRKGRHWRHSIPLTHCPRGHEYTSDNVYLDKGKYRICKRCALERAVVQRDRKRATKQSEDLKRGSA